MTLYSQNSKVVPNNSFPKPKSKRSSLVHNTFTSSSCNGTASRTVTMKLKQTHTNFSLSGKVGSNNDPVFKQ